MRYLVILLTLASCNRVCNCTTVGSYNQGSGWVETSRTNFTADCEDVTEGTNYSQQGAGYQVKVVTSCD